MQPYQLIIVLINRNDEAEFLFLVTHTYTFDEEAVKAIQNHVTMWLLTAAGRKFVLSEEFDDVYFPWSEICTEHPEVVASTPGVTKFEYLPYQAFALGRDDNPAPWSISVDRLTGKRRIELDHNMIEELLKKGTSPCSIPPTPSTPPSSPAPTT